MNLYSEDFQAANEFRARYLGQVKAMVTAQRAAATVNRRIFFQPETHSVAAYENSIASYREQFKEMLGWPLGQPSTNSIPAVRRQLVASDSLSAIFRLWVETLPGLEQYGLLFLPPGQGPFPLIIGQHGGLGTPELCSGFFGSANYNDLSRRFLRRGYAVFAPQLQLWNEMFGPLNERQDIDRQLKQLGGSITALELWNLQRSLDHLVTLPEIDPGRIGMAGLSYGGFYTLFLTAIEPRIRAALSSCWFNNRFIYDRPDWVWFNAASQFFDGEIASMICPRPLFIEVGRHDPLFDVRWAQEEAGIPEKMYHALGIEDRFVLRIFEGVHEFCKEDAGLDFMDYWLRK